MWLQLKCLNLIRRASRLASRFCFGHRWHSETEVLRNRCRPAHGAELDFTSTRRLPPWMLPTGTFQNVRTITMSYPSSYLRDESTYFKIPLVQISYHNSLWQKGRGTAPTQINPPPTFFKHHPTPFPHPYLIGIHLLVSPPTLKRPIFLWKGWLSNLGKGFPVYLTLWTKMASEIRESSISRSWRAV